MELCSPHCHHRSNEGQIKLAQDSTLVDEIQSDLEHEMNQLTYKVYTKKAKIDRYRLENGINSKSISSHETNEEKLRNDTYIRILLNHLDNISNQIENLDPEALIKQKESLRTTIQNSSMCNLTEVFSDRFISINEKICNQLVVLYKQQQTEFELNKHKAKYSLSEYYTLRWKRTDQLYELWGFIQVYKSLLKDGFRLVDGLNFISVSDDFVFEDIKAGKSLLLSRNDEVIRLAYNGEIPTKSEDSDLLNNPFFTTGSNKTPDCCIDCYRYVEGQKQYFHSIVIDCKYRKFRNVWESERSSSKHQIKSYKNDTSTLFHKDLSQSKSLRTIKPVLEVMILYPDRDQMQWDEGVRFVSLIPGEESLLKEHLSQAIKDIYD